MTEFIKHIQNGVLVLDGAMGTMIQNLMLPDSAYGGEAFRMLGDLLVFSRPECIEKIHFDYLAAGAHAIETNSFGASPLRLREYDLGKIDTRDFSILPDLNNFVYHLNKTAAEVARSAIKKYHNSSQDDGVPRFVLGSLGPSNFVISSTKADLNRATYRQIEENFYTQVLGLIDGGVDVLVYETQQDPLELKAAIHGGQKAMKDRGVKLPIMVQVTVDAFGKMQIFNTDILAVLAMVQGIGIDVFGINCSIGPDLMERTVQKLSRHSKLPISVVPNAGLPVSENGKTVYKLTPENLADSLAKFVFEYGVNVVGGCCGTNPEYIRVLANAVKKLKPATRQTSKQIMVSGPQNAVAFGDGLIRIGERLNVRGSLKVRNAVERQEKIDFEALEEVVREQVADLGVNIIDVCMDSNVVNTEKTLVAVIQDITTDFQGVMCLDSFSVEALLVAFEVYPGRPILNSISLEEYAPGVDKIDALVAKTVRHDPVYVALCTDTKGPAVMAEDKVNLARKIYEKCRDKYGVRADQLIIDVNAFPIGAESDDKTNFALESLRAIPLIKKIHPDLKISMGVGNLTNGLAKKPYMRKVLTSVFMDEACKRGMDAAIINPDHYVPIESLDTAHVALAHKVIFNRDMDAFSELERIAGEKQGIQVKKCSYDELSLEESICQKIKDGHKQRMKGVVSEGDFSFQYEDGIVPQVAEALKTHQPLVFINDYLMAAMKELGDGFARGEVSLPHLLKSADVMKRAMNYIEAFMRHHSGVNVHDQIRYKGVVVLGTVYQDVHSIGKDLTKTLLENYGYRVIDLGVQTPLEQFVNEARKHRAHAVGMSALLVQTSNHMITVARLLQEAGLGDVDILIGGAPVNHRHAAYVSMFGQNDPGKQLANVFYCPSGMDGVNVMNQLVESPEKRKRLYGENAEKLKWHYEHAILQARQSEELMQTLPRRIVGVSHIERKKDLYFRNKVIRFSMKDISDSLDTKTLFSLNWRYGGKSSWQKKGVTEESLKKQLAEWIARCDQHNWLIPQAVCGIYPCQAEGDVVIIYDPENHGRELARFDFSVVIAADKKDIFSASQYFLSKDSKKMDAIGLQISTGGLQVDSQIQKFKEEGDLESAHLLQGLSDRVAEDLAGITHSFLRECAQIDKSQGTRYSPGYPGLKELKVNLLISNLLKATSVLPLTLTEAHEFYPTGSTAAVVCFHPDARYD